MAKNLTPISIPAPGYFGINLSESPIALDQRYALDADNAVIDKSGRLSCRKGWTKQHSTNSDLGTGDITCIGEVLQSNGTATIICTGNGKLFKLSGSSLVTLSYGGGDSSPTISSNNWQFCQLNGIGIFWQRGYDPLIYDP